MCKYDGEQTKESLDPVHDKLSILMQMIKRRRIMIEKEIH